MPLLTEAEYLATMGPSRPLDPEEATPSDLGQYLQGVEPSDYQGFGFSQQRVAKAMSVNDGTWHHVLLAADAPNVFLVVVIEGPTGVVHGHHLLDLNRLYGQSN